MIVFFSKAFSVPTLIPVVKDLLIESTVSETTYPCSLRFCGEDLFAIHKIHKEDIISRAQREQMLTRTGLLFLLY